MWKDVDFFIKGHMKWDYMSAKICKLLPSAWRIYPNSKNRSVLKIEKSCSFNTVCSIQSKQFPRFYIDSRKKVTFYVIYEKITKKVVFFVLESLKNPICILADGSKNTRPYGFQNAPIIWIWVNPSCRGNDLQIFVDMESNLSS